MNLRLLLGVIKFNQKLSNFEEKKVLINSYFYEKFKYCPLVWVILHPNSLKKAKALRKRARYFLYDDCNSLSEEILKKSGKGSIEVNRLRKSLQKFTKVLTTLIPAW